MATPSGKTVPSQKFLADPFKFMDENTYMVTEPVYNSMTPAQKQELLTKIKEKMATDPNRFFTKIHTYICSEMLTTMTEDEIKKIIDILDYANSTKLLSLRLNPHPEPIGYAVGRVFNVSFEYAMRLNFLALTAFMYRMHQEYEDLFHYNEMILNDEQKKVISVKKAVIKEFLDKLFTYSPTEHVSSVLDKKQDIEFMELSGTKVPVPPRDTRYKAEVFRDVNYDDIVAFMRDHDDMLPGLDYAISIFKTFGPGKGDTADRYATEEGRKTGLPLISFPVGGYTLLAPYAENRHNTNYTAHENEAFRRMLTAGIDAEKFGENALDKRHTNAKKRNIKREGPDDPELETRYSSTLGKQAGMTTTSERKRQLMKEIEEEQKLIADHKIAPIMGDEISETAFDMNAYIVHGGKMDVLPTVIESGQLGQSIEEEADKLKQQKDAKKEADARAVINATENEKKEKDEAKLRKQIMDEIKAQEEAAKNCSAASAVQDD